MIFTVLGMVVPLSPSSTQALQQEKQKAEGLAPGANQLLRVSTNWGYPKIVVFVMENHLYMDDSGIPPFMERPILSLIWPQNI